jgi:hypothetical protein
LPAARVAPGERPGLFLPTESAREYTPCLAPSPRFLRHPTLIITPANLSFQWQRELKDKFREHFEVVRFDVLRANYGSNPWQEKAQVIPSISWVSRIEDAKDSLLRAHGDLVIVDEAHKRSAASRDQKTLASPPPRGAATPSVSSGDERKWPASPIARRVTAGGCRRASSPSPPRR